MDGFSAGNLMSGVGGAVVAMATVAVEAALDALVVLAAQADIANILEDGKIDDDEVDRFLEDISKLLVGAVIAMFGSRSSGGEGSDHSNGPTLEEAAEIAENVYFEDYDKAKAATDDLPLTGGWRLVDHYEGGSSLQIGVYARLGSDGNVEYVIANRGSRPPNQHPEDWVTNAKQPFGAADDTWDSLSYVKEFVKNHPDSKITYVGHSKGGAEAAGNAVETKKNAMLFNPAAVNLEAYGLDSSDYNADMTAYIVNGEVLNDAEGWISEPIGNEVYLPTQYPVNTGLLPLDAIDAVENHLMPAVKESIKQYNSNEKVIISRTMDNKAKEAGEELNQIFKNSKEGLQDYYEEWKYNYEKGMNDLYDQTIKKGFPSND